MGFYGGGGIESNGSGIPSGVIVMWSGLLANIPSGWALCDGTNGTPNLQSKFIKGGEPGITGGASSVNFTPAGTVSQPTFTGSALGTHSHGVGSYANTAASAGTPTGTVTAPIFTGDSVSTSAVTGGTPTGSVAWPVGVPTASGAAVADHAAHTHSVTSNVAVADHASHTHTSASSTASPKLVTSNTSSGVSLVTGGPSVTLTHAVTNNAVSSGNPNATLTHGVTQPTITWPAGVPTFSGNALGTHSHTITATGTNSVPTFAGAAMSNHNHTFGGTSEAVSAGTPAGTVSRPSFTGNSAVINTEPEFFTLAFIIKL